MGPDFTQVDQEAASRWKFHQGFDGIPFRTQSAITPSYKSDDPLHKRPKLVADMRVRQFDLNDEEQRESAQTVLDRCAKGKAYLSQKELHFDESIKGWRMLLIWGDFYLEDPKEAETHHAPDRKNFS